MSPSAIVKEVKKKGLGMFSVTDHNACGNLPYVNTLAQKEDLVFIPGVELQTEEEVHLLAYFENVKQALLFGEEIYQYLPDIKNDPSFFGDQVVVDEGDNIVAIEDRLLINSLTLSLDRCVEIVRDYGGIAIPAHVDREPFGVRHSPRHAGWPRFPMPG